MMLFTCQEVAKASGLGVEAVENWLLTMAGPKDFKSGPEGQMLTMLGRKKFEAQAGSDPAQGGGVARAPVAKVAGSGGGGSPGPRREDLRLIRHNLWSRRSVLAVRENGLEVQVLVRDTSMLLDGMVLKDCIEEPGLGWNYMGRLPRLRGEQQLYFPKRKEYA